MSVDGYLSARRDYLKVADEVRAAGEIYAKLANALVSNPLRLSIANTGVALPMAGPENSINADDVRSARQVMELLAKLHDARKKVLDAYAAVSPDLKDGLKELPDGVLAARDRFVR